MRVLPGTIKRRMKHKDMVYAMPFVFSGVFCFPETACSKTSLHTVLKVLFRFARERTFIFAKKSHDTLLIMVGVKKAFPGGLYRRI